MKFILCILSLIYSYQSVASTSENKIFSGTYLVTECAPSCDRVNTGRRETMTSFDFSKMRAVSISVVDKPLLREPVCDGSNSPFEFNLWAYGEFQGVFMSNNLKGDFRNPWRNVCDGKFVVSGNSVSLKSTKILLELRKNSERDFELRWQDQRWGVDGTFKLQKVN